MHSSDRDRPVRRLFVPLVLLLAGCESEIPSPPAAPPAPPPSSFGSSADAPRSDSRAVAFIMARPDKAPAEIGVWEQALRTEGNRNKIIVEVAQPGDKDAPGKQAELIRDAVNRGVAGLLVVPDPESADALVQARDSGAIVVLVDHSIELKGKPLPVVAYEPAAKSAEALVAAAIQAAKEFELSPKGPALIVRHKLQDSHSVDRAHALEEALKRANVEVLPPLEFNDEFKELSTRLGQVTTAHPKLPMIFIADEEALMPTAEFRNSMYSGDRFAMVAYATESKYRKFVTSGQCAAIADVNPPRLAHKALQVLMEIKRGKTPPDRVDLDMAIHRAKRNDNTLTVPLPKTGQKNL
jgi:ABC-type sugar transport system substrate-binding protein